ncbi:hypothetical protein CRG98_017771 [Punica granatum]|uniref:RNase H type-1 domain-containing protein n=1 Tax=Punica granatum TaxID=22663 RepID=A0A2I0K1C2_PUNGR|nr:hypothetical protein CRG98_017771 [Punica granatum]
MEKQGIFEQNFVCPAESLSVIRKVVDSFRIDTEVSNRIVSRPAREWKWIKWLYPPSSWVKLNTDGTSRGNPGAAGAGGLIRDDNGRWLEGFAQNVGYATATIAELWGIKVGLELTWALGF